MLKVTSSVVSAIGAILSVSLSFGSAAKSEFNTLTFQGEIAEPGCYSNFSSISCYDQNLHQFTTLAIQTRLLTTTMSVGDRSAILTDFEQINYSTLDKVEEGQVLLSLNYN
ncbi:hypothetical protein [Shewanella putrefaciens]|uniref:hypothetical protein n=1 Tax=Shewanella putrefaciens TaxID=24 RepID=UPI0018E8E3FF|nr:hypothetical protein [Shewanella putrefaciens]